MPETDGEYGCLLFFILSGYCIFTEILSYLHPSYFNQGQKGVLKKKIIGFYNLKETVEIS